MLNHLSFPRYGSLKFDRPQLCQVSFDVEAAKGEGFFQLPLSFFIPAREVRLPQH